jgi:hypothetical protein
MSDERPLDLFAKFNGIRPMARELNKVQKCSPGQVHNWKAARSVPPDWQRIILDVAASLNLDVTAEDVVYPFPEDREVI